MKKVKVLTVTRTGTDYGMEIPAGTEGRDVEIGLATAVIKIAEHSNIKPMTLLRALESWVTCINDNK